MGCRKGGSHNWRNVDRPYKDGSVLQQCRKCSEFRETNQVLKMIVVAVIVIAIVVFVVYQLEIQQP
jgi:hypothetical protein